MKAKDFFKELKQIENQIESKTYMISAYRNLAKGVKSPTYSEMPKNPNRQKEPLADALMKVFKLEEELGVLEQKLIFKRGKLMDLIMELDKDFQVLLIKRYFEKKSWGEIATEMFFSERWIYKLHGLALKEMDKLLKSSV